MSSQSESRYNVTLSHIADLCATLQSDLKQIIQDSKKFPDIQQACEQAIQHLKTIARYSDVPNALQALDSDLVFRPLLLAAGVRVEELSLQSLSIQHSLIVVYPSVKVTSTMQSLSVMLRDVSQIKVHIKMVQNILHQFSEHSATDDLIVQFLPSCVCLCSSLLHTGDAVVAGAAYAGLQRLMSTLLTYVRDHDTSVCNSIALNLLQCIVSGAIHSHMSLMDKDASTNEDRKTNQSNLITLQQQYNNNNNNINSSLHYFPSLSSWISGVSFELLMQILSYDTVYSRPGLIEYVSSTVVAFICEVAVEADTLNTHQPLAVTIAATLVTKYGRYEALATPLELLLNTISRAASPHVHGLTVFAAVRGVYLIFDDYHTLQRQICRVYKGRSDSVVDVILGTLIATLAASENNEDMMLLQEIQAIKRLQTRYLLDASSAPDVPAKHIVAASIDAVLCLTRSVCVLLSVIDLASPEGQALRAVVVRLSRSLSRCLRHACSIVHVDDGVELVLAQQFNLYMSLFVQDDQEITATVGSDLRALLPTLDVLPHAPAQLVASKLLLRHLPKLVSTSIPSVAFFYPSLRAIYAHYFELEDQTVQDAVHGALNSVVVELKDTSIPKLALEVQIELIPAVLINSAAPAWTGLTDVGNLDKDLMMPSTRMYALQTDPLSAAVLLLAVNHAPVLETALVTELGTFLCIICAHAAPCVAMAAVLYCLRYTQAVSLTTKVRSSCPPLRPVFELQASALRGPVSPAIRKPVLDLYRLLLSSLPPNCIEDWIDLLYGASQLASTGLCEEMYQLLQNGLDHRVIAQTLLITPWSLCCLAMFGIQPLHANVAYQAIGAVFQCAEATTNRILLSSCNSQVLPHFSQLLSTLKVSPAYFTATIHMVLNKDPLLAELDLASLADAKVQNLFSIENEFLSLVYNTLLSEFHTVDDIASKEHIELYMQCKQTAICVYTPRVYNEAMVDSVVSKYSGIVELVSDGLSGLDSVDSVLELLMRDDALFGKVALLTCAVQAISDKQLLTACSLLACIASGNLPVTGQVRNTAARLFFRLVDTHVQSLSHWALGSYWALAGQLLTCVVRGGRTNVTALVDRGGFGDTSLADRESKLWEESKTLCLHVLPHTLQRLLAATSGAVPVQWLDVARKISNRLLQAAQGPTKLSQVALNSIQSLLEIPELSMGPMWPVIGALVTALMRTLLLRHAVLYAAHTCYGALVQLGAEVLPHTADLFPETVFMPSSKSYAFDPSFIESLAKELAAVQVGSLFADPDLTLLDVARDKNMDLCVEWARVAVTFASTLASRVQLQLPHSDALFFAVCVIALHERAPYLPLTSVRMNTSLLGVVKARSVQKENLLTSCLMSCVEALALNHESMLALLVPNILSLGSDESIKHVFQFTFSSTDQLVRAPHDSIADNALVQSLTPASMAMQLLYDSHSYITLASKLLEVSKHDAMYLRMIQWAVAVFTHLTLPQLGAETLLNNRAAAASTLTSALLQDSQPLTVPLYGGKRIVVPMNALAYGQVPALKPSLEVISSVCELVSLVLETVQHCSDTVHLQLILAPLLAAQESVSSSHNNVSVTGDNIAANTNISKELAELLSRLRDQYHRVTVTVLFQLNQYALSIGSSSNLISTQESKVQFRILNLFTSHNPDHQIHTICPVYLLEPSAPNKANTGAVTEDQLAELWQIRLAHLSTYCERVPILARDAALALKQWSYVLCYAFVLGTSTPDNSFGLPYVPVFTAQEFTSILNLLNNTVLLSEAMDALCVIPHPQAHLLHLHPILCECIGSDDVILRNVVAAALTKLTQPLISHVTKK